MKTKLRPKKASVHAGFSNNICSELF